MNEMGYVCWEKEAQHGGSIVVEEGMEGRALVLLKDVRRHSNFCRNANSNSNVF